MNLSNLMSLSLAIFVGLFSTELMAKDTMKSVDKEYKAANCRTLSEFNIVSLLGKNIYEVKYVDGYSGSSLNPRWNYSTAILTLVTKSYTSTGKVNGFYNPTIVEYVETRKMKMKDGFMKDVKIWNESHKCIAIRKRYLAARSDDFKAKEVIEKEEDRVQAVKDKKTAKKRAAKNKIKRAKRKKASDEFDDLFE